MHLYLAICSLIFNQTIIFEFDRFFFQIKNILIIDIKTAILLYHLTKMTYFIASTCISKHFQFDAFDIKPNHSLPPLSLKHSWNIYLSYTEAFIFNFEKCFAKISCSWNKQIIIISRHQYEFPPGHTPKADLGSDYEFFFHMFCSG